MNRPVVTLSNLLIWLELTQAREMETGAAQKPSSLLGEEAESAFRIILKPFHAEGIHCYTSE